MIPQWKSDTPIYLQLYEQVVERIIEGVLLEGDALPSMRKLAAEYQLNPLTISKSYQMLQDEGVVEKQRGKGLYICPGAQDKLLAREREQFMTNEWPSIKTKILRLKLNEKELLSELKENG